jgi:TolA-binding protein
MRKLREISNLKFEILLIGSMLLCGCPPDQKQVNSRAQLQAGYAALENKQYDEAIAKADAAMQAAPAGQNSADALYLRGRGFEGRVAANPSEAKSDLQQARTAYISALAAHPTQPLESYIHCSLANVAYFQDDYQTAAQQWMAAYDALDREEIKSWSLYRIGVCQQRLGQFAAADQTFAQVLQRHPNSPAASKAREHQGARAFFVQLATYATSNAADAAAASLRKDGAMPLQSKDAQGRAVVRLGPVSTYAAAETLRGRYAAKYPDAIIVP